MSLPFVTKTETTTSPRKYVFALEISPSTIKGAIWTVVNEKTQVVSVSSPIHWDDKTEESLITACDQVLSDATSRLDASGSVQVDEVIFGLCSDWVDQDKVKASKMGWLKALSSKLELKPIGFVITVDAITKYLQHSEGVPPSTILLGFWPRDLEVTLVRMGKTDGVHLVRRSSDVTQDVVEGLSRYQNVDMMPSRMLLYDSGMDLEEVKQLLLNYSWQTPNKKLPFLHFPKIEVLPADFTVRAVALSGGEEVARAIGMLDEEVVPGGDSESIPVPIPVGKNEGVGFLEDVDVSTQPATSVEELDATIPPTSFSAPKVNMPKFNFKFPKIAFAWPSFNNFSGSRLRISGIGLGVIGVLILILLGVGYWYLPQATVMLYVTPRNFTTQFEVVVDSNLQEVNLADSKIPGEVLETTVSAEETIDTTGSKLIGDRAVGSVVISNALDSSRSLPAGTVLTSPSGLKFVLDEAVVIASASGSAGNLNPGKSTVKVSASQIGTESNLSAGTVFRVGNLAVTQVDAKNDVALSGGSSRQARAVAKGDLATLTDKLTTTLKEEARQKLLDQVSEGQTVISESIVLTTASQQFTAKEGDEGDRVGLKMSVKASGWVVSKSHLASVVEAKVTPQVPQGYAAISESSESFKLKDSQDETIILDANISAQLLPDLDKAEIAQRIRGKYPGTAQEYLSSLSGIERTEFLITPPLPAFLSVVPRVVSRINIEVKPSTNP